MGLPRAVVSAATAAALVLTACTSSDPPAEPSADPSRPPTLTIIGENIELLPGDDLALRIGFEPAEPAAQVIVRFEPADAHVSICPLDALDGVIEREGCRLTVGTGVREPVAAPGMSAIAILLDGDAAARTDLVVEFAEGGRDVSIAIPRLRAPTTTGCEDNRCNPFFEVLPTAGGPFTARATWTGPEASLLLLQGRVRGRSFTATGVPYAEPARDDGASPLSIETRLSAPGEYAFLIRHRAQRPGDEPLRDVLLEASFPEE